MHRLPFVFNTISVTIGDGNFSRLAKLNKLEINKKENHIKANNGFYAPDRPCMFSCAKLFPRVFFIETILICNLFCYKNIYYSY